VEQQITLTAMITPLHLARISRVREVAVHVDSVKIVYNRYVIMNI